MPTPAGKYGMRNEDLGEPTLYYQGLMEILTSREAK
jgi:hypothetical protein